MGRAVVRGLLWGLLAAVLVLLAVLAVRGRSARTPPPPVLGELPAFTLQNRDGRLVASDELAGAPWVADFIFTRCPGPCPLMSRQMAALGEELPPEVRRVSFTVDPGHDTPEVLAAYAERYGAPASWLFLTGQRQAIWDLSVKGFKLGVAAAEEVPDAPVNEHGPVLHSTRFVLVDPEGRIRGYYDAFEPADVDRLLADARTLAR